MGLWGAIKKTLNSTVGTADMVSLDKIFLNQKKLVASDTDYLLVYDIGDSDTYPSGKVTEIEKKVKMVNGGSARIKASLKRQNTSTQTILRIYVDGNLKGTLTSVISDSDYHEFTTDIVFEKGSIISFTVTASYFQNLRLCANITDASLYEIEEV